MFESKNFRINKILQKNLKNSHKNFKKTFVNI